MHEVTDRKHWHEPSGENRAGFGKFGRPKTPYDLFMESEDIPIYRDIGVGKAGSHARRQTFELEDGLDIDTQAAQLILELTQTLDRLFRGLDGGREARDVARDFGGQVWLGGHGLPACRWKGLGLIGRWRLSRCGHHSGRDHERGDENSALT